MSLNLNRRLIIKWLRDPASQRPETAMFLERAAELLEGDAHAHDARQLLITLQFARPAGTKDPIWDELATFVANLKAQPK